MRYSYYMSEDLKDAIENAADILSEDDRPEKLKSLIEDIAKRFPGIHKLDIFNAIVAQDVILNALHLKNK